MIFILSNDLTFKRSFDWPWSAIYEQGRLGMLHIISFICGVNSVGWWVFGCDVGIFVKILFLTEFTLTIWFKSYSGIRFWIKKSELFEFFMTKHFWRKMELTFHEPSIRRKIDFLVTLLDITWCWEMLDFWRFIYEIPGFVKHIYCRYIFDRFGSHKSKGSLSDSSS